LKAQFEPPVSTEEPGFCVFVFVGYTLLSSRLTSWSVIQQQLSESRRQQRFINDRLRDVLLRDVRPDEWTIRSFGMD